MVGGAVRAVRGRGAGRWSIVEEEEEEEEEEEAEKEER